jgi:hypothetical protein
METCIPPSRKGCRRDHFTEKPLPNFGHNMRSPPMPRLCHAVATACFCYASLASPLSSRVSSLLFLLPACHPRPPRFQDGTFTPCCARRRGSCWGHVCRCRLPRHGTDISTEKALLLLLLAATSPIALKAAPPPYPVVTSSEHRRRCLLLPTVTSPSSSHPPTPRTRRQAGRRRNPWIELRHGGGRLEGQGAHRHSSSRAFYSKICGK